MKKLLFTLFICLMASFSFADSILIEGFEYGNHDLEVPVGWVCSDNSWLAGFHEKDHNRIPHAGNWYAFTDADDSWMFMELFFSSQLKYRYHFWAISDGEYDVEFWVGSGPSTSEMSTLLFTKTVNSGEYQRFSEYIETIAANYQYFGIHAIAHEGAFYLTIDDVTVDVVGKYDFIATPSSADTILFPGSQATFHFDVQNLGYEPIVVIFSPSHEYFTNFHFYVEGNQSTSFPLDPDETKHVRAEATLKPEIQAGTLCWLDIMLVLDCDCATSMTTLWVSVVEPAGIEEHSIASIYPNPTQGPVTIEGTGQVTVSNAIGQTVLTQWMDGKETFNLPKGFYLIRMEKDGIVSVEKLIVE
ncbi:MAG: T9SS type A sorting domain-containing protein [Bacteroidales bacterium]|nr:T9SS type A sorting domain-containing protein [Bacteroidales bacterium]